ncbi:MAG TPA: spore germination protein, partial [Bacillota bacterium]
MEARDRIVPPTRATEPSHYGPLDIKHTAAVLLTRVDSLLAETAAGRRLSPDLAFNLGVLRRRTSSDDVIIREFTLRTDPPLKAAIVYIEGLSDNTILTSVILPSLMAAARAAPILPLPAGLPGRVDGSAVLEQLKEVALTQTDIKEEDEWSGLFKRVLSGDAALLVDGAPVALILGVRHMPERSVEEPTTEAVIRGPRDGFIESLSVNLALLRRRLHTPDLRVRKFSVGERTQTDVAICYLEGLAHPELVAEVRRRLEAIRIDAVLESGYLESFLE